MKCDGSFRFQIMAARGGFYVEAIITAWRLQSGGRRTHGAPLWRVVSTLMQGTPFTYCIQQYFPSPLLSPLSPSTHCSLRLIFISSICLTITFYRYIPILKLFFMSKRSKGYKAVGLVNTVETMSTRRINMILHDIQNLRLFNLFVHFT